MFGRKQTPAPEATSAATTDTGEGHDSRSPKGRPTPSRKDAEAARKQQLKIPRDPKAAKAAAKDRDRDDRARARAGMMSGDERYLPARDKGPAKAFARDFVDSRFTIAEFFIFVAVGVLVLGFLPSPAAKAIVSIVFYAFTAVIILDTVILLVTLNRRAKVQFPNAADRKGITLYAALRTLQLRRLRMPAPRVKRGGTPV
jgi:hypothetical protein